MESFKELGLPEFLGKSLQRMNFVIPTPIQAQAIPPALEGKDVIASAQTGTGKTAAFGIPLLTHLFKHRDQTSLILTPTRELAVQVLDVLRKLSGDNASWGSVLLIGGAPMGPQLSALQRKPRMVVGTPGRVIDHLNRKSLNLAHSGFLVLDEADRMLDMGFAPQLEKIRQHLPVHRQTVLFSATIPPDIQALGARYLKDPVRISAGPETQPIPKIAQMIIHTNETKKFDELKGELEERKGSVLLFCRTQNRVDRVLDKLKELGMKATRIHGGRSQSQRRQAIDHFREGRYLILVATDIAARGLDIHHIAHVINYDLPRNPEDYIHRVGRTARAGAEGASLCLLTPEDRSLWERILKLMKLPKESVTVKPSRFGIPAHTPGVSHTRPPQRPHTEHRKGPFRQDRPFDKNRGRSSHFAPKGSGGFSHGKPFNKSGDRNNHVRHFEDRSSGGRPHGEHRPANRPFNRTGGDRPHVSHVRHFQDRPADGRPQGEHRPPNSPFEKKPFRAFPKNSDNRLGAPVDRHKNHFRKNNFRNDGPNGTKFIFHGASDSRPMPQEKTEWNRKPEGPQGEPVERNWNNVAEPDRNQHHAKGFGHKPFNPTRPFKKHQGHQDHRPGGGFNRPHKFGKSRPPHREG